MKVEAISVAELHVFLRHELKIIIIIIIKNPKT